MFHNSLLELTFSVRTYKIQCFMPVQHNHGMSADDAFNPLFGQSLDKPDLMPVSKGELGGRPQQNGGRQRPIAGGQAGHHNPMHTRLVLMHAVVKCE